MRRDVQHWERALELARQIDPEELPFIAKEACRKCFSLHPFVQYAIQLEFVGQHEQALHFYEEALVPGEGGEAPISEELEEHNWVCKSGHVVCSFPCPTAFTDWPGWLCTWAI